MTMTATSAVEPVTAEVVRHYLVATAEEMRTTLMRTSFNPTIYEGRDFGISVYDSALQLIAESTGVTGFLGANDFSVRKGVEHVGVDRLEPGDVVILNYPYWNGAHSSDATVFSAVFDGGTRPFAFLCIRAHWKDLGAKDAGYVLDSTDMHQEGLMFPGTKIFKRGRPDEELLDLLRVNSRTPQAVIGDLHAQVAALRTGERRLLELLGKFGRARFDAAVATILENGEATTRAALARLPHGSWTAVDFVDDDGISTDLVRMQVRITIADDLFEVDFSGSSPATRGPINMPFGGTLAISRVAMKAVTSPREPSNAGQFRALRVKAEPGTLFHAVYPAPTYTLWTKNLALELLNKALAQAMPDRMQASSGGDYPGFMMVGRWPATGELFVQGGNSPVGWGATSEHDGADARNFVTQSTCRNIPIEVLESMAAVLVERLELRTDSGGPGRWRGGVGVHRELRFLADGDFLSVVKKTKTRPWAVAGGHEAETNSVVMFPGTPEEHSVGTRRVAVRAGDCVRILTAGGGGHGDPRTRDPERVRADVDAGLVSPEAARSVYGVSAD